MGWTTPGSGRVRRQLGAGRATPDRIIHRAVISVDKLSPDPRSPRRRRTVANDQLSLALGGPADHRLGRQPHRYQHPPTTVLVLVLLDTVVPQVTSAGARGPVTISNIGAWRWCSLVKSCRFIMETKGGLDPLARSAKSTVCP